MFLGPFYYDNKFFNKLVIYNLSLGLYVHVSLFCLKFKLKKNSKYNSDCIFLMLCSCTQKVQ